MKRKLLGILVVALLLSGTFATAFAVEKLWSVEETGIAEQYNLSDYVELYGETIKGYNESPYLAELVAAGKLPPVEERLPAEPLVYRVNEIGTYGGELRVNSSAPTAFSDVEHMKQFLPFRADLYASAVVPEYFRDYTITNEGKTLTIFLREGMKWSDGSPLTVDDILFWWNDIILNDELTPVKPSRWRVGGELAKFSKVDDYTLQIDFAVPNRPIMALLSNYHMGEYNFIVPSEYLKTIHIDYNPNANEEALANGFESWVRAFDAMRQVEGAQQNADIPTLGPWMYTGRTLTQRLYERNPYFFAVDHEGNQLPYIDSIVVDIVPNREVSIMNILNGELTHAGLALGITMEDYPVLKENESSGNYSVMMFDAAALQAVFTFNQSHKDPVLAEIFSDSRFRQAMSLAIDRDEINDMVYFGTATPRQMTVQQDASFYKPEWAESYAQFDLDRANQLLDEMGLKRGPDGYRLRPDGERLSIVIQYALTFVPDTVVELVGGYWNRVGVDTEVRGIDRNLYQERGSAGDLDLGVWNIDRMFELRSYITGMDHLAPDNRTKVWSVPYGLWYSSGGELGEEPTGVAREFIDAFDSWHLATTDEEYFERAQRVWDLQAEHLFYIGTVAFPKLPVVISNKLGNTPINTDIPHGDDTNWWGALRGVTWYIK